MLNLLAALVEKSLVRTDSPAKAQAARKHTDADATDEPRFTLSEPIREYALERLAASPDAEAILERHAHYFTTLAEAAAAEWDTPLINAAIAQQRREHDNIRAALEWARDTGNSQLGLQLAVAMWGFWRSYGYISEGRGWLEQLLKLDEQPSHPAAMAARQRGLHAAAWLASDQHDYATATRLFEESMTLRQALGETTGETDLLLNAARQARAVGQYQLATALLDDALINRASLRGVGPELSTDYLGQVLRELGLVQREQGNFERATILFEEGLALHRASGDRVSMALELLGLSDVARDQGDSAGVRAHGEPSLAILREFGMQWAIGFALNNLALAAYLDGDLPHAFALANESVSLFRTLQSDASLAEVLITRGKIARAQGDLSAAAAALIEALQLALALGPRLMVAVAMEALASVVAEQGQIEPAVQLLAPAAAVRAQMGTPLWPADRATVDHTTAIARATLGAVAFARLWANAQLLPIEQALSVVDGAGANF
jgi:tetratricopeptide (TPR) repeat protein